MKYVEMVKGENLDTRKVLVSVIKQPEVGKGVTYDEMNKRLRLIDVVNGTPEDADGFLFEDEDWNLLTRITRVFQFGMVDQELADILKGILEAKKPEKAEKPENPKPEKFKAVGGRA